MVAKVFLLLALFVAALGGTIPDDVMFKDAHELSLGGLAFLAEARESPYDRLPLAAKDVVAAGVWNQSIESAGVHVDFETDASEIYISYELLGATLDFTNMDAMGCSGVDLYAWDPSSKGFRFVAAWAKVTSPLDQGLLADFLEFPAEKTLYRIHLPLYNRVKSFKVGVSKASSIFGKATAASFSSIVWYGTSIAQGKASSLPSSSYISQLNLALYGQQTEVLNFGFSSNGHMDIEVAQFLTTITPTPRAFVIDCLPNMNDQEVAEKTGPLVRYIRAAPGLAAVPILLVESATYANEWFNATARTGQQKKREALRAAYNELVTVEKVQGLHLVAGGDEMLPGTLASSPFPAFALQVDGTHPTDLGMRLMYEFWMQRLSQMLL